MTTHVSSAPIPPSHPPQSNTTPVLARTAVSANDEEMLLGMGTTTKTQIKRSGPSSEGSPPGDGGIQVQKAVYQTNSMRRNQQ